MSFPIASLRDDFADNSKAACWTTVVTGSATIAETGGQIVCTLPSSTAGSHLAYLQSTAAYDLTGDSAYVNIGTMVSTAVAAQVVFDLVVDASNILRWRQLSGTITARTLLAGVETQVYTAAWNSSTYKYLRIRESGGGAVFESSTNGTAWTTRATVAGPLTLTNLFVQFGASCGNVGSPGSLRIDDFNLILPAPSATWRETTADWQITNRMRSITLASDGGKQGAIVTADTMDSSRVLGGTLRYFAGPLGSSSGGYLELTEYASLALAQASAFPIPIDGRIDLPAQVDCRFMRLYHRSTDSSSHDIYEYFPRRLVQADDIEAESITAINISAGAITADKINVLDLSAITATIGQLTIASSAGLNAWLYQGTGTGDSPTTGLKLFNSGGIGKLSTYNTAVEQITLDTDGRLKWAAGNGRMDANGAAILTSASFATLRSYAFRDPTAAGVLGGMYASGSLATPVWVKLEADASANSSNGAAQVTVQSIADTGNQSIVQLQAVRDATTYELDISIGGASDGFSFIGAVVKATGGADITGSGVNVGSATGAAAGQIATSGAVGVGVAAQSNTRLAVVGQDGSTTNYALYVYNSTLGGLLSVRNDGAVAIGKSGAAIGAYGSAGTTKPTVTGSRGGNAALASLLTALANIGWIVDSSS